MPELMRKLEHDEIASRRFTQDQLKEAKRLPIYLLLENVRSLYNVGSIFRTADGARITKLLLCGYTPHPPRKEIEKTALGATLTVPWEYYRQASDAIAALSANNIPLCLVEQTDHSVPYFSLSRDRFPVCLVIGNEITGISKEIISHAIAAVDIPMYGMKQSLNAAVAAGIVLFECVKILRQEFE